MKTEGVKRKGYTVFYRVYEAGVDFVQSDDLVIVKTVDRYSLHDGYGVWRVEAAIKRGMKTQFYYIVAINAASAVNKFLTTYPWLSAIKSVGAVNKQLTDLILNSPHKYILW